MSKMISVAAAAAIMACGSAFAGLGDFSQAQSQDFAGQLSPFGPINLTFDQFDDNGGLFVLKAITLEFDAEITANVTAENNNQQAAPEFGVQLTGFVNVDVPAPAPGLLSGTALLDAQATSGGVAGTDGVPGSGPDFHNFGTIADGSNASDTLFANFGAFVGNGTVDAEVFGQGGFTVTGASSAQIQVSNFGVSGTVTITYHYNIIPAPGAAAAFGLFGLGATRRRR